MWLFVNLLNQNIRLMDQANGVLLVAYIQRHLVIVLKLKCILRQLFINIMTLYVYLLTIHEFNINNVVFKINLKSKFNNI